MDDKPLSSGHDWFFKIRMASASVSVWIMIIVIGQAAPVYALVFVSHHTVSVALSVAIETKSSSVMNESLSNSPVISVYLADFSCLLRL